MKLLLQKIAALLRRHSCNRQPPLKQGEFQFRTCAPHRICPIAPSVRTTEARERDSRLAFGGR
ncbi:MAG: hypothetical protein WCK55_05875 [Verrucomicrobiota bacterium]